MENNFWLSFLFIFFVFKKPQLCLTEIFYSNIEVSVACTLNLQKNYYGKNLNWFIIFLLL